MEQRGYFTQSETEGVWDREKRLAIRTCLAPRQVWCIGLGTKS
jgi:hypothetical protein